MTAPRPARSTRLGRTVRRRSGRPIVVAVVGVIAAGAVAVRAHAGAWDVAAGDVGSTVPLWSTWLAALVGIAIAALAPPRRSPLEHRLLAAAPTVRRHAAALVAFAVLFASLLLGFGAHEPIFTGGKLVLLVVWPLLVMRGWQVPDADGPRDDPTPRHHLVALVAVLAWGALTFFAPWSTHRSPPSGRVQPSELAVILLVGFLVNAVIEEIFYRRWLQTRLETLAGRWTAIASTSILFGAWHAALGSGDLLVDLAGALLHQGVIGVFLGYLWSRLRLMWPLLVAHGALNALPMIL